MFCAFNIIYNILNCRKEFKDELEDRTTPDQESEGIVCTVKVGKPVAKVAGRRMMA